MAQTALSAYRSGMNARRSKGRHRTRAKMTIPLMIVAGFLPGVTHSISNGMRNGWITNDSGSLYYAANTGVATLLSDFTGVQTPDAQMIYGKGQPGWWSARSLGQGLYPLLVGFGLHWGANKIGLNRMLSRMKVPIIRL